MVGDSDIFLQTNYLCISNICAIEKGAQEEQCEDWENTGQISEGT